MILSVKLLRSAIFELFWPQVHIVSQFQSHTYEGAFLELFKYTPDVLHIYKER